MEQKIKSMMKQEFNIGDFGHFGGGKNHYLTAAICPKCGSENIFLGFLINFSYKDKIFISSFCII
jgi:hypothetical protein